MTEDLPIDLANPASYSAVVSFLEELTAGNPAAWEEAFRCLYPVAFAAAHASLGNMPPSECEDVAMETLVALVQAGVPVSDENRIKPWVAAVARKKAADKYRRQWAAQTGWCRFPS